MGVILDVGQPYMEASIELCRIFNAALSDIGYAASMKLVPNETSTETNAWLLCEHQGIAGEIKYNNNAIVEMSFYTMEDAQFRHWFSEIINLNEPDSIAKLGKSLRRFASGRAADLTVR